MGNADGAWNRGQKIAAAVFIGVLVFQVGLPLSRLAEPRPARFGWHMYSGVPASVRFEVLAAGDSLVPVELEDAVVNPRADLDYAPHLVPHLCRTISGAREVRLVVDAAGLETLPCD